MGLSTVSDYFYPLNPVTQRREVHFIPAWLEKFVGENSFASQVKHSGGEVISGPDLKYATMVLEVGEELAAKAKRKDLNFEFKVLKSDVDNAWCLPGGKIGINMGLIKHMETAETFNMRPFTLKEKIAAVLSHEIIHADARHTGRALEIRFLLIGIIKATQLFALRIFVGNYYQKKIDEIRDTPNADVRKIAQLTKERDDRIKTVSAIFDLASGLLLKGLTLCKSRSHELESDKYGMHLMQEQKSYSPEAAIWLQRFFEKHHQKHDHETFIGKALNLFSTHPAPGERLAANLKTWKEIQKEIQ